MSAFGHVLRVDPAARTAVVGGMTTYEDLADATLRHGLMPLVVPQLKTITLGGAVTGLGIESTSLRNGLPHESVTEMEILTGDGRVVTATDDNEHAALYRGFPNSYGTLGYALSLTIELEPAAPFVHLRHFRFDTPEACMEAIAQIARDGSLGGHRADFVDGTAFSLDELYLTVGAFSDVGPWLSDYTRERIYYQSIRGPKEDFLTIRDYLWRWDTDWFWCSRAFGVQNPVIRRVWPRRYRRSDIYRKLVALDRRYHVSAALNTRRGRPEREFVTQDVEIPVERGARVPAVLRRPGGHEPRLDVPAATARYRPGGTTTRNPPRYRPGGTTPRNPRRYRPGGTRGSAGLAAVPDAARPGLRELRLLGHGRRCRRAVPTATTTGRSRTRWPRSAGTRGCTPRRSTRRRSSRPATTAQQYAKLKHEYDGGGRLASLYDKTVRAR